MKIFEFKITHNKLEEFIEKLNRRMKYVILESYPISSHKMVYSIGILKSYI